MMMQEAVIQKLLLFFESMGNFLNPFFFFSFPTKQMLNDLNHDLKTRSQNFISDETRFESHKLPFRAPSYSSCYAFSFLLRAFQENDRWAEENADFEILLAIRNCSSPFLSFSSCCSDVRALFLPIISDSRARSLGKNDLHTTSAISLA